MNRVTYSYPSRIELSSVASPATASIPNGLFMTAGVFDWNGQRFPALHPGIVCLFGYPVGGGGYRIITPASPDPYDLIGSMFQFIGLGSNHDNLTPAQALIQMRYGKIFMTCGFVANLMKHALGGFGFQVRKVFLATSQAQNGFDDGHVIFEVMIGGKWRLFDTFGNYFTLNGQHLSLSEVVEAGVANCTLVKMTERVVAPANLWVSGQNIFPHNAFFEQNLVTDAQYMAWAERIYDVPAILHTDGYVYFYRPAGTDGAIIDPNWINESKSSWLSRFY